jgi:hypothetical protein
MTNNVRKKFKADFWKEHFQLFIQICNESNLAFTNIKSLRARANTTKVTAKKDASFANDLNDYAESIDIECWNKFLKRVRDDKFEEGKIRIRISKENNERINAAIEKYDLKNRDDFLDKMFKNISSVNIKRALAK